MRFDVTTEIIVAKPPGVVAAVAVEPGNVSKWYAGVESVGWKTSLGA